MGDREIREQEMVERLFWISRSEGSQGYFKGQISLMLHELETMKPFMLAQSLIFA